MQVFRSFLILVIITKSFVGYSRANPDRAIGHLKIGAILPLSGSQEKFGQEAKSAMMFALKSWKRANSKFKTRVSLLIEDDQSQSDRAKVAAENLIKKRVSVLLGSINPLSSNVVQETASKHNKLFISPFSCEPVLAKREKKKIFCGRHTLNWQGIALAKYAFQRFNEKKIAVLIDLEDNTSISIAHSFSNTLKEKGLDVIVEKYSSPAPNWINIIQKLKEKKIDIFLFSSSQLNEAEVFLNLARQFKTQGTVLGSDLFFNKTLNHLPSRQLSVIYPVPFFSDTTNTHIGEEFFKKLTNENSRKPSHVAVLAYDATVLILETFKKSQSTLPRNLTRSIKNISKIPGLYGYMKMSKEKYLEKPLLIMRNSSGKINVQDVIKP